MTASPWIRYGFIAAGVTNVAGIPVFSKLFTNTYLMQNDFLFGVLFLAAFIQIRQLRMRRAAAV